MQIRVLVVEDDASLRQMYAFKLQLEGFLVETAEDGLIGLGKTRTFKPDAILLDIRMPVMDGEEMLSELRKTEAGKNVKVIVLTNLNRREAPMSLALLHVSRYIVKAHTTPRQVIETLREVLEG
jgi:two-component system, chemotaxis family, chemotaxis protein CheY